MKAYDTSAKTLQTVLKNPLLQLSNIDETTENMSEALANHKEIEDAIGLGNEDTLAAAGVSGSDEKELEDELEALVLEQKKEEEAESQRIESEAKANAEKEEAADEKLRAQLEQHKVDKTRQDVLALKSTDLLSQSEKISEGVGADDGQSEWGTRYQQAQAEKAAQTLRNEAAETETRARWDRQDRQRVAEGA